MKRFLYSTYSFHETGLEGVDQLHLWEWIHLRCCKEAVIEIINGNWPDVCDIVFPFHASN